MVQIVSSGNCGENVKWQLDSEGTLTISGSGVMTNYSGNGAPWFDSKESIKEVVINNGVTSVGKNAFVKCSNLISVRIPNSVASIEEAAFFGCSSLTNITIPNGVASIGYAVFSDCSKLKNITVDTNNQYYSSIDGGLLNKAETELIRYPEGNTSYVIPSGVTEIVSGAFYNCSNLTSITIPDSVTNIRAGAFQMCQNLTDVYYKGSEAQWNKIKIGKNSNSNFLSAEKHYNS